MVHLVMGQAVAIRGAVEVQESWAFVEYCDASLTRSSRSSRFAFASAGTTPTSIPRRTTAHVRAACRGTVKAVAINELRQERSGVKQRIE